MKARKTSKILHQWYFVASFLVYILQMILTIRVILEKNKNK